MSHETPDMTPEPGPAPVALPTTRWGAPDAPRRALLAHGLSSSGPLMWRFGCALADAGWHVAAVDLRGHGAAPRALDYSIAAYAADLGAVASPTGGPWDLVLGHSLGGAASVVAAAADPDWTARLVLLDPALHLDDAQIDDVALGIRTAPEHPTTAILRAQHPHWHPLDVELKVRASLDGSAWAMARTTEANRPWDVRAAVARLSVPTHVIAADPELGSLFTGESARQILASNPLLTSSVVAGAGHSVHRDRPEETIAQLMEALS